MTDGKSARGVRTQFRSRGLRARTASASLAGSELAAAAVAQTGGSPTQALRLLAAHAAAVTRRKKPHP